MLLKTNPPRTEISEVFSSLQGEGPYLGKKQIFVRFGRCNMHCTYCDEASKMEAGAFQEVPLASLVEDVYTLENNQGPHHSVSLTGGEPLFYSKFLESFLPELKAREFKVYLETNGTLPRALKQHLPWIDIIAMDLKPPSSSQDRSYFKEHAEFLKLASSKEVFVKVVITTKTSLEDIETCVRIVQETDPLIPFVFQPESELTGINLKALKLIEEKFIECASKNLKDVRVIPQMHKIWGVR